MKYIVLAGVVVSTLLTGCVTAPSTIEDVYSKTDTYDRKITYFRVVGAYRVLRVATTNNNEVVITPANLIGNEVVITNEINPSFTSFDF